MLRDVRVLLFTAVCLLLSVTGHALAAGAFPAPAGLVAGGGLTLLLAARLAGRERSLGQLAAGVLGIQLGLHTLFGYLDTAVPATHQHEAAGSSPGAGMLAAHLAASLIAGWWLRHGEARAWRLCRWLAAAVTLLPRSLAPLRVDERPVLPAPSRRVPPAAVPLRHAVSRRGPPVAFGH